MKSIDTPLLSDFLKFDVFPNISISEDLNFIYKNIAKKTLIVINSNDKDNLDFLTKILKAIQFDITQDVILLALDKGKVVRLTDINKNVNVLMENVLLFGVSPKMLSLQFNLPKYYDLKINDILFLGADTLSTITKNQAKKKQLWLALQKIFLT